MRSRAINRTYIKRLLIGLFFLVLIIAIRFLGIHKLITIAGFKLHRETIKAFVDAHYFSSVVIYVLSYSAVVALSLPLALVLTIIGGFLFGVVAGVLYVDIAGTIGASIAFLITRYVLYDAIQHTYEHRLKRFNQEMHTYGVWYLLGAHLLTVVPFFVINTFAAMTPIPFWKFFITTALSIIPGAVLYTFAGKQLMTIETVKDVFSPRILIILIVLSVITVLGFLVRRYVGIKNSSNNR